MSVMKLKKNDKIILIVGVVILIASGAGIALYNVDDSDDSSLVEDSEMTYEYTWTKKTGEANLGSNIYAGKGDTYDSSITLTTPTGSVLTKVDIELSWEDDCTYGLLKKNKGQDILEGTITYGSKEESMESVGSDNITKSFTINNMPKTDAVQATSEQDAKDAINELISGDNKATFAFYIDITPGEKIWRLLKWTRDKGNEFDLTATYTYYTYELDTTDSSDGDDDDGDDTKNTGADFGHNVGEFYINLGYGRGMI